MAVFAGQLVVWVLGCLCVSMVLTEVDNCSHDCSFSLRDTVSETLRGQCGAGCVTASVFVHHLSVRC